MFLIKSSVIRIVFCGVFSSIRIYCVAIVSSWALTVIKAIMISIASEYTILNCLNTLTRIFCAVTKLKTDELRILCIMMNKNTTLVFFKVITTFKDNVLHNLKNIILCSQKQRYEN